MVMHARLLLPINLLKTSLLVHGTEKLCYKFGEDRFVNDITIWFTDAGHRTCQVIFTARQHS